MLCSDLDLLHVDTGSTNICIYTIVYSTVVGSRCATSVSTSDGEPRMIRDHLYSLAQDEYSQCNAKDILARGA